MYFFAVTNYVLRVYSSHSLLHKMGAAEYLYLSIGTRSKLELYRAHTPRAAASISNSLAMHATQCRLLPTFTYILLCQVVRMSRKHMVGSVNRRGQQNAVFATLVDLAKRFEA